MTDTLLAALRQIPISGLAAGVGMAAALITFPLTRRALRQCDAQPGWSPLIGSIVAALLSAGLTWACLAGKVQEVPEVLPSDFWWRLRPVYQSLLMILLVVATATDIKTYYILDWVTVGGMVLGVLGATIAGDLQMCHVWVDWNAEVPQLRGPEFPAWLSSYPHWHGLAWSLAGLVTGAGITWSARWVSSLLLGQEALGFGDVTMMGMIGAFTGWQPVLIIFLLAPLCALGAGLIVRLCSSKTYVPYGPYLALAALLVLFNWSRIWMFEINLAATDAPSHAAATFALRRLFGDGVGLLILAGMLAGGLILLLGAWRLYLSLPVEVGPKTSASE
jgi:leader peptidase (prepilin peptidase)/N-methyltransferase